MSLADRFKRLAGFIRQPGFNVQIDIDRCDSGDYEFVCLSDDPQLHFRVRAWWSGWYMLELAVEHDQPKAHATLYLDTGRGFNPGQRVDLPLGHNKISKRLVYLPRGTRAIRLDPMASAGRFTLSTCRLVWLSSDFAMNRLLRRLTATHPQFQDMPVDALRAALKRAAQEQGESWNQCVLRCYDETFRHNTVENNYNYWLAQVEPVLIPAEHRLADTIASFQWRPLISVLLPVYNTDPRLLAACVESVINQSYPDWQLCIADDASTRIDTREALEALVARDPRIEIVWRERNGHISAASNSALGLTRGDYAALLDHDDLLSGHALFQVVEALNHRPQALLLYSDEDKLDSAGQRFDPHFKSAWNPDLLLSQNYISHLGVYQTHRMREIGGFREGVEGSQDHDLVLRFTEGLSAEQVVHIPHILYHWRAVGGSTALDSGEKDYTSDAGLRAVSEFVARQSPTATVLPGLAPNSYQVRWPVPTQAPLVSLLVPTRDGVEILKPCVDAILEQTEYVNFELIILDNQSSCTDTLSYMADVAQRDPRVRVLNWDHPFNYSAINNFGVAQAKGSIIGLVNNDVEPVNGEWLTEMVSQVCRPEIGCVGAKLYYPNDTLQHGGVILGLGGVAGHSHKHFPRAHPGYFYRLHLVQNLSAVTAACLLVRKSVYEQVGGLNEEYLKVAFNDVDFCIKVREAGYRNLWTPYAEMYHHESVSRGADDTGDKRRRAQKEADYMRQTWGEVLDNDPAYNRNLTLAYEDFSLR